MKPFIPLIRSALRFSTDPLTWLAMAGMCLAAAYAFFPKEELDAILQPKNIAAIAGAISAFIFASRYLGVFKEIDKPIDNPSSYESFLDRELLRDIHRTITNAQKNAPPPSTQINLDDAFQAQLLSRLESDSQLALKSFVESEIFKKSVEAEFKETERTRLFSDIDKMIYTYQAEMSSWRRNANLNLLIGLACAIAGIGVMWQTLITLNFEFDPGTTWKLSDLYRFLARFGLVLIIESVAFFFLKLYREDRSMIRYLRNEITNLESRFISLKSALTFGLASDVTKVLEALSATERNFLVKKDERVIAEITYENSEIVLEKLIARLPELVEKVGRTKTAD